MSFLDEPRKQNYGIGYCCECKPLDHQPTHKKDLTTFNTIYWCQTCGNLLTFKQLDAYAYSPRWKTREEELKQ